MGTEIVGAVGKWKSRRGISKGRWERWKTCFWFSTVSTGPPFPRLSGLIFCSPAGKRPPLVGPYAATGEVRPASANKHPESRGQGGTVQPAESHNQAAHRSH